MPTWQQIKSDPSLLKVFKLRQEITSLVRKYFEREGFLELFTPIMQPAAIPESYLDLFSTDVIDRQGVKHKRFLIPSPEVSIKKLMTAGVSKCFEITRGFRNRESGSDFHNYEFTIVEWYRSGADYMDILRDYKNMFYYVFDALIKKYPERYEKGTLKYGNFALDLSKDWEMLKVSEALKKYSGLSFDEITDMKSKNNKFPAELIGGKAAEKGYSFKKGDSWEEIFNQILLNEIEPHLGTHGRPTVIYDYPAPVAALARLKDGDNRIAERFEVYMARIELADCCTELTDYAEQKRRFAENLKDLSKSGKNEVFPDTDFLEALKTGLPDSSGIAMGLDRLVMLFADKKSLKDTILTFS